METILLFFNTLRWNDLVDIALNSYIIFRLYVMFRGTQAFHLLLGVLGVWLFQRFAVTLGLVVTSWVLQGVTAVLALIIIVVFRSEIKSVFQTKGLKAFLWYEPPQVSDSTLDEIAEAAFELSRKHIGALIVFPGREDVSEVAQGGIRWRGIVSKEMIKCIFWPGNPVHDGAAVVVADQVVRVGTILPLSQQSNIPSLYGTRHRAALGMSESTDAMILTVSEERGEITLARAGALSVISRRAQLIDQLTRHTGSGDVIQESRYKNSLRTALAALISVVFISGLWFSFTGGRETLVSLQVPLTFNDRKNGMEIVDTSVNVVRLHLAGSGALIRSIRPEQIQVGINLSRLSLGENQVIIEPGDITIPPGIKLERVEPSLVNIVMDKLISRKIPVQIDWNGRLNDQLIMTDAATEPEMVEVTGNSISLGAMQTVYTQPVPLNTIAKSDTQTVGLALDSQFSTPVTRVRVRYQVKHR